jgi:FAD binding domain/Berberine and berberine like
VRPLDRRELLERTGRLALGAGAIAAVPGLAAAAGTAAGRPLRELAREIDGSVVTPASASYAKGKLLYNTRFDASHPRAIVYCESAEDVQKTVRWSQRHAVHIVPRCGGHSYGGYSTAKGVVVDVTRMERVRVRAGTATVGAGARLIDVYAQLAAQGVTIPAGSCPSVGIAGLTLGGGASYAGREFGLTCDNVLGLSVVTADGRLLQCNPGERPDLFWACRGGGGGNFGIVTSFRFRTHAVANVAYYQVVWPWTDAADVVRAWQSFAPYAPDELFSTLFMSTRAAKGPGTVPAISSGGQFFGSETDLAALIAPLSSVGAPMRVTVGTLSYMEAVLRWAGCHPLSQCRTVQRIAFKGKSDYVKAPLSNAAIATLLAGLEVNQADPSLGKAELLFDPYGGAINRVPPAATAFVHRDALFSIQYFSSWTSGAPANLGWIRNLYAAMRPHVSGFAYQNYIDPDLANWKHAYYGSNLRRLVAVKRKYDARSFFTFAQAVPPRL